MRFALTVAALGALGIVSCSGSQSRQEVATRPATCESAKRHEAAAWDAFFGYKERTEKDPGMKEVWSALREKASKLAGDVLSTGSQTRMEELLAMEPPDSSDPEERRLHEDAVRASRDTMGACGAATRAATW